MNALFIARRDLAAYFNTYTGWAILSLMLAVTGLLFNGVVLTDTAQLSHEVLEGFFEYCGGVVMITGLLITMRALAEEHLTGTDVLLHTSTASSGQIVAGKYLAAMAMLTVFLVSTLYLPGLIFVNGKVSLSHVAVGYLGMAALGSTAVSIGIAGSSLFRSQVAAGVFSGFILVSLIVMWMLADVVDAPLADVFAYGALWNKHFTEFQTGRLPSQALVYYGSMSFVFLTVATRILEGRRWQ